MDKYDIQQQYRLRSSDLHLLGDAASPQHVHALFTRLARAVKEGDEDKRTLLRDHLVMLHRGLVDHCVRDFRASSEPIEDLIQEGYVGLIKAVDRYDPRRGTRFSTYACHLIDGEIRHYLRDLGRLIHEPGWHFELRVRVAKAQEDLAQQLRRPPSEQEIASALNVEEATVQDVLKNWRALSVEFPDQTTTEEDEDASAWDMRFPERDAKGPVHIESQLVFQRFLPRLGKMQRQALMLYFFGECSKTEIAHQLGISINHAAYVLKRGITTLQRMIAESEEIKTLPSSQARARAAFILGQIQREAGIKNPHVEMRAHHVPPTALIQGILPFAKFVEILDTRVAFLEKKEGQSEEDSFSLLWLHVSNWDDIVAELGPALRHKAGNAIQILTYECCRTTDCISVLTPPDWPGLHFAVYLPDTGSNGSRVARRWSKRCRDASYWPTDPVILQGFGERLHTEYAFRIYPRDGETVSGLFRGLGKKLRK